MRCGSRNCLQWWKGDKVFESSVAADVLDNGLARCFHVVVTTNTQRSWAFGLCTPLTCSQGDVLSNVHTFIDLPRLTLRAATEKSIEFVEIQELTSWGRLGGLIDFAIIGFVNSGSSTLVKTLSAHPEVSLDLEELDVPQSSLIASSKVEDGKISHLIEDDWRSWLCADLLPLGWVEALREKKRNSSRAGQKVFGVKNPLLLYSEGCIQSLAKIQPSPKLIVAVRDPIEWLLSIFRHDLSTLGFGFQNRPSMPSDGREVRGGWFGQAHAKFGTALEVLLRHYPSEKVLAVELEHLRTPAAAAVVLDAVTAFLEISSAAELGATSGGQELLKLQYDPGLRKKAPQKWGRYELCLPESAEGIRLMSATLEAEYKLLPGQLARIGVNQLGVSSTILLGGAFMRHCSHSVSLPGARLDSVGKNEMFAEMQLLRVDWRGEIGFKFRAAEDLQVVALACGAGAGPLRRTTYVTLWDVRSEQRLTLSAVSPFSPVVMGFAYGEAFRQALPLKAGEEYAVTVQASPGLGLSPANHANIGISAQLGTFLGGVFSKGPWIYPSEVDEHGWEGAYVNLVTLRFL
ncbi:unnamed protein product [Polarella glacialis]|uniref:Uncharacterized protein n=1 Tax=Polarella glacialis TaxID=89957 RepID=A0A813F554_POLGL|nr:unnamed protein product [Polarella glacialis]